MNTELIKMIQESLARIEAKVEAVSKELSKYSNECSVDRTVIDGRLSTLESFKSKIEESKKQIRLTFFNVLEKVLPWFLITYVLGKEAWAKWGG